MGIDVHQIHNLVRTYQRALHPESRAKLTAAPPVHQEDHVSLSVQARARRERDAAATTATPPEKPRIA